METISLFEKNQSVDWEYDDEADVLYVSFGEPRPAVGIDAGDGIIVRYDESAGRVVGLTVVGLRARIARQKAGV